MRVLAVVWLQHQPPGCGLEEREMMHVELVQSGDMGGAEGSACARRERVFGRGDGWHKHSEAQVRAR